MASWWVTASPGDLVVLSGDRRVYFENGHDDQPANGTPALVLRVTSGTVDNSVMFADGGEAIQFDDRAFRTVPPSRMTKALKLAHVQLKLLAAERGLL